MHHVIAFLIDPDEVDAYHAMDDAEDGPGYTCFGGPTSDEEDTGAGVRQLAGWVPGAKTAAFPAGTGVSIEPGSALVLQMHYNTVSADPQPDQTSVALQLAGDVDRPALIQLVTDPEWLDNGGMPIPAGDASVTHTAELDLPLFVAVLGGADIGVAYDEPFAIHSVNLHMHELGVRARTSILRADGTEDCLLGIDDWDFNWQGSYRLAQPIVMQPEDRLILECEWDNSAANQPIIDGVQAEPIDVQWGEGTRDEMCLAGVYITATEE